MGSINKLAETTNSKVIPADATSMEDLWGLYKEALQGFNAVLAENYNFYSALKGQALSALALENHDLALAAFRKTQAARTLIAKNEKKISRLKLRHDREQFRWLEKFSDKVSIFDELDMEIERTHPMIFDALNARQEQITVCLLYTSDAADE